MKNNANLMNTLIKLRESYVKLNKKLEEFKGLIEDLNFTYKDHLIDKKRAKLLNKMDANHNID